MKFNVKSMVNKGKFTVQKYSPEILMGTGILGIVTSGVMLCTSTVKAQDILKEHSETLEKIHEVGNSEEYVELRERENYTEETYRKDITVAHAKTALAMTKTYAPAVLLGVASIACIVGSQHILKKRNVALAAAYATVDKGFKEYRGRVIDKFGEEVDKELRYNIKAKEIEETVTDEKGKEKTVKKKVEVSELDGVSEFARFFDSSSREWDKNPEYNLNFLKAQEAYANNLLQQNGILFLNDVYKMLDLLPSKAGQVVGWRYCPEDPNCDSFVSFGIYEINRESNRRFVNGYEPTILLDFNVDGNVWEYMK